MRMRLVALGLALAALSATSSAAAVSAEESTPGPIATASVNVPLPEETRQTVVSPDARTAYTVTWGLRNQPSHVQFVDVASARLQRSVAVGEAATGPALTPDGKRLATGSWHDKSVTILDTRTGKVLRKVPVGGQPDSLFIGPKGSSLFAFLIDQGVVAKIDLKTYRVTGRFPTRIGGGSCKHDWTGMAMTRDSRTLLLACSEGGLLFMNPSNGRITGYDGGAGGGDPLFSPDRKLVYTGVATAFHVTDARTGKPVGSVDLHSKGDGDVDGIESPMSLAVMPDGSKIYATMPEVGQISVLDPRTGRERSRISYGGQTTSFAHDLTLSRDGSRLYATRPGGGLLTIDTATDTVIGVEPGTDPTAAAGTSTWSGAAVLLSGPRIGQAWSTFPDGGDLTAAGFRILTMPAR